MATPTGGIRRDDVVIIALADKTSIIGRITALSPHKIKIKLGLDQVEEEVPTNTILWKARVIWKSIPMSE
jgi:hypothetical protein